MRACPACGASNDPGDDFCGNCGSYLGWSQEGARESSAPAPASPAPAAEVPPEPAAPPEPEPAPEPANGAGTSRTSPTSPPRTSSLRTRLTGRSRRDPQNASRTGREGTTTTLGQPAAPADPPPAAQAGERPAGDNGPTSDGSSTAEAGADGTSAAAEAGTGGPPTAEVGADDEEHGGAQAGDAATSRTRPETDNGTAPVRPAPSAPASPEPEPESVGPVQPAKPVAPRPVVRSVPAQTEVSGLPCRVCGTPNPPGRRFCRRCASPLAPAQDRAPLPWWRTIWPFRRQVRAGSGRGIRFLVILAVVVALCVGGFFLLPAGRALFEDTRDKLSGTKAVTPVRVEASAEVPGHPAKSTTDGLSNRYWGSPGAGASITYTFGKPFRLVDLIITNGASTEPEEYARQARALEMDLEVTSADGSVHRKEIDLSDKPGTQTITTGTDDVVKVRMVLRKVTGLTGQRHVALAEVEFFQRS
ncbi:zinc ribbon domain-containing protein [Streptomyces sp. FXJ1.172]|uniref:zinc ribbon domain-containing protein n=1 Tax=Streptomyces sp. FXJ1.172 TaxID=710705 RepID=UPI000A9CDC55|nr:zinc ribbon domain-containing protein [Streptomyces sp. FXJ1.172]WEO99430.1 zinc ribbon domain-containing protein [Streptomyces sp. FXJ1.172]